MTEGQEVGLIVGGVFGGIALIVGLIVWSINYFEPPIPTCSIHQGDVVYSTLTGERGQVVSAWAYRYRKPPECEYDVRFESLGAKVRMKSFELRCEEKPYNPEPF